MSGPNKLRKESPGNISPRAISPSSEFSPGHARPLRIVASGTLFITHTLTVDSYPSEHSNTRAQAVVRVRGGSAAATLSVLAQFSDCMSWLVAPIGSGPEGASLRIELEREGISTQLCPRRETDGVPKALDSTGSQTVINHNPIPDVTHDEYFRILGPLLYSTINGGADTPKYGQLPPAPPVDWFHFEGRSPHITGDNLTGLDSWLKERGWRDRVVLSVEVGRPERPGQDILMQLADVIFFSKPYAVARSFNSPRAFLLSLRSIAPPHALLIASWGKEGAGLLSMPTREYFQSSPFVPDPAEEPDISGIASVRTSTAAFSSGWSVLARDAGNGGPPFGRMSRGLDGLDGGGTTEGSTEDGEFWNEERRRQWMMDIASPRSSSRPTEDDEELDETEADDSFIAGMIFALSRRILPGLPYSPARPPPPPPTTSSRPGTSGGRTTLKPTDIPSPPAATINTPLYEGRWRLDECLRFATEMAGRRMRRKTSAGLALVMEKVGWRM
ncbi:hypothetical protein DL93DRAFT_2163634 [Clavulina sp. PMI_390]|nr:hypothetical protein DL93DRAFT_2163634 [Clavulina sp. PMI_390]